MWAEEKDGNDDSLMAALLDHDNLTHLKCDEKLDQSDETDTSVSDQAHFIIQHKRSFEEVCSLGKAKIKTFRIDLHRILLE